MPTACLFLRKTVTLVLLSFLGLTLHAQTNFRVGFSQCTTDDEWRQEQLRMMEVELSFYPEMEMIMKDARANNQTQIRHIEEFIKEGIDLLIVSPNESEPLTPVVEKAFLSGIPVIVIDRKISGDSYTAYVGGDNHYIGCRSRLTMQPDCLTGVAGSYKLPDLKVPLLPKTAILG